VSAIAINSLTKNYGDIPRVDSISFEVPRGSVCGFVGPNGSGKTTTMRMLLGLIRPSSGEASILGHSIQEPGSYLHKVGAMIEGPAFYPHLSAEKNLRLLQKVGGIARDSQAIARSLTHVGLAGREKDRYKGFSLGMKQRLGIAAALMFEPELLILDEPTNGLDPVGAVEVRELITTLAARGLTIFISSHLLEELEIMCDYFVMIQSGKIQFAGSAKQLMNSQELTLIIRPEYAIDQKTLLSLAREQGFIAEILGDSVHIANARGQGAHFNRLAAAAGINLEHLQTHTPTLTEIFFSTKSGPR